MIECSSRALLIEDDPAILRSLAEFVSSIGYRVHTAEHLGQAKAELHAERFDVVLSDLQLPDGTALDLLDDLAAPADTNVILITGHGSVDSAVRAFRSGAVDYLTKPVDMDRLRNLLTARARAPQARAEVAAVRELGRFGTMVGVSRPMQAVYEQILRVAETDASVLVTGETGTGKELVAQTIHDRSKRSRGRFVAINCGAISSGLIESELFGHERGSFTGATRLHQGLFEQAHGGTLFLDEIGEMPLELQVKLLRALESRQIRRIGGDRAIEIDVRVVAATNRDPARAVADGTLRDDLLYRLNVFPIALPPLRERGGDVAMLAAHLLYGLNRTAGLAKTLTPEAIEQLAAYAWPGNVRELRNAMERAFILASEEIRPEMLPFAEAQCARVNGNGQPLTVRVGTSIASAERALIEATLEHTGRDKRRAAALLGISLKTLYNRLQLYRSP
jgi:DNA-binding NtrC family response regulator